MISVCMATYNGSKYIEEQINSILKQLDIDDEIVVSDDGSSDGTLDILNKINDKRIKIFQHNHDEDEAYTRRKRSQNFYRVTSNFQNALKNAKGDYIYLSDQDDIWIEDRVKLVQEDLMNNDIVMTNYMIMDENSTITNAKFCTKSPISKNLINNIIKSKFLGCCMAFRRNVLDYCLPFPANLIAHDYWIGCLGVYKFRFYFEEKPLHMYRRSGNNVSASTEKSSNTFIYKIMFRLEFLFKVVRRIMEKNK